MTSGEIDELRALESGGDLDGLIAGLAERVRDDRRTLTDPWVKQWCGRRWRNLFLTEAERDPGAVDAAQKRLRLPGTDLSVRRGGDDRNIRQQLADRFLRLEGGERLEEMPDPAPLSLGEATLVICPGLISTMLPNRAFERTLPVLADRHGVKVLCADTHPMRGCAANVDDLVAALDRGAGLDHNCVQIPEADRTPPGDVFLIGYSKGTPDALALLAAHPELAPRVRALYCWGGAVGGSFLADDIYERVKDWSLPEGSLSEVLRAILKTVFPIVNLDGISERLDEYDVAGAIRDLTTSERERFLSEHAEGIDALDVPIFNLTAATSAMEVPFFQVQGYMQIAKHDPDNDMQLTQAQAKMATPMATDLAVMNAHHWDISYDPFPRAARLGSPNLDHRFPREAALLAICHLTAELGLLS